MREYIPANLEDHEDSSFLKTRALYYIAMYTTLVMLLVVAVVTSRTVENLACHYSYVTNVHIQYMNV